MFLSTTQFWGKASSLLLVTSDAYGGKLRCTNALERLILAFCVLKNANIQIDSFLRGNVRNAINSGDAYGGKLRTLDRLSSKKLPAQQHQATSLIALANASPLDFPPNKLSHG
jgi:hypothetical protein